MATWDELSLSLRHPESTWQVNKVQASKTNVTGSQLSSHKVIAACVLGCSTDRQYLTSQDRNVKGPID